MKETHYSLVTIFFRIPVDKTPLTNAFPPTSEPIYLIAFYDIELRKTKVRQKYEAKVKYGPSPVPGPLSSNYMLQPELTTPETEF